MVWYLVKHMENFTFTFTRTSYNIMRKQKFSSLYLKSWFEYNFCLTYILSVFPFPLPFTPLHICSCFSFHELGLLDCSGSESISETMNSNGHFDRTPWMLG
jgi:hypothetical protein